MAKIFLSYRRADTDAATGRIADHLVSYFGAGSVFEDVADIEAGENFRQKIAGAIEQSEVVVAVIGRQWLSIAGENGERRLDNEDDVVRYEIASALAASHVKVIPVLVSGADMPEAQSLPDPLKDLADLNALTIDTPRFRDDVMRLCEAIGPPPVMRAAKRRAMVVAPVVIGALLAAALVFFWPRGEKPLEERLRAQIESLETASTADPSRLRELYVRLADEMMERERYPDAIAAYEGAGSLRLDPPLTETQLAEYFLKLAQAYGKTGQFTRAYANYEQFARLAPGELGPELGQFLLDLAWATARAAPEKSKLDNAVTLAIRSIEIFETAKETKSALEARRRLASIYLVQDKASLALAELEDTRSRMQAESCQIERVRCDQQPIYASVLEHLADLYFGEVDLADPTSADEARLVKAEQAYLGALEVRRGLKRRYPGEYSEALEMVAQFYAERDDEAQAAVYSDRRRAFLENRKMSILADGDVNHWIGEAGRRSGGSAEHEIAIESLRLFAEFGNAEAIAYLNARTKREAGKATQ